MTPEAVRAWIEEKLQKQRFLLLDGATGTELERRGFPLHSPLWSASAITQAPELLQQIHEDYLKAGADIVTANTFRTTPYILKKQGMESNAALLTQQAIEIARSAIHKTSSNALLAVSIGPLEDCYSPQLVPNSEKLTLAYSEYAKILSDFDFDLALLETQVSLNEAAIAAEAIRRYQIPVAISFVVSPDTPGRTLCGDHLNEIPTRLVQFNPLWIGVNCVPVEAIKIALESFLQADVVSPNLGIACNTHWQSAPGVWRESAGSTLDGFLEAMSQMLAPELKIVGGCCGTTPEHIAKLARLKPVK